MLHTNLFLLRPLWLFFSRTYNTPTPFLFSLALPIPLTTLKPNQSGAIRTTKWCTFTKSFIWTKFFIKTNIDWNYVPYPSVLAMPSHELAAIPSETPSMSQSPRAGPTTSPTSMPSMQPSIVIGTVTIDGSQNIICRHLQIQWSWAYSIFWSHHCHY